MTVEPLYRAGIDVPPIPCDPRNRQKTPFSFQRFLIPEVRGYRGLAMYLDSEMLVFDEIGALFERDFGDANVLAVPRETSVLLLDCEQLACITQSSTDFVAEGVRTCERLPNS